jgi:DNA polymerase I
MLSPPRSSQPLWPDHRGRSHAKHAHLLQDAQILEDEQLGRLGFCADNAEKLDALIASLATHTEVAIDTETYPIDDTNAAVDPRRGKVRIIAMAAGDDVVGVIDARAVNPRPLLDALQGKTLVAFNAQFDLAFLRRLFGYEHRGPVVDPCVLDVVLKFAGKVGETTRYTDKGRQKRGFDPHRKHYRKLGEVLADYVPDAGDLGKEEQASDWGADNLSDEQLEYAAKDAQVLIPLAAAMRQKFEEADMMRIYDLENRFTPSLAYTQDNGFALDVAGWKERCARKEEELFDLKAACDDLAPPIPDDAGFTEWAWTGSSHRRVGLALELLGADVKKNSKGNCQTSESDLETIASPEAAKNLAQAVLRYREAQKQLSTWGMSWFDPPKFRPKARKYKYDKSHQFVVNGRVHGRFNQVVRTGRISSEAPNFQNIPPVIRDHFIAPPGRRLVIGDFKQIEYVVLAALTQEEALMEGFRHGEDIHTRVAKTVFGLEEVSKADRKKAKEVSFGIAYGISDYGLATRLSRTLGREVTETEAHGLIVTYLDTMPKVKLWYFDERSTALSGDKITKSMAGRLRLLDMTKSKRGKWYVEPSLRLNTPVQGSAGDGFKYAAALAHERLAECPGNPMVVNYVHDELVLEVDEDHTATATKWLKACMIDGMTEVLGDDHRDLINVDLRDSDVWRETEDD